MGVTQEHMFVYLNVQPLYNFLILVQEFVAAEEPSPTWIALKNMWQVFSQEQEKQLCPKDNILLQRKDD